MAFPAESLLGDSAADPSQKVRDLHAGVGLGVDLMDLADDDAVIYE